MTIEKQLLIKGQRIHRKKPQNITSEDEGLFLHEYSKEIKSFSYYELENVYLLQDTIFKLPFHFFESETHINGVFTQRQKIKYLKWFFKRGEKIEKAIWVTQNWTWMYFHWLTDALPRLVALKSKLEDHKVLLPQSYKKYQFVEQSLDMINVSYVYFDAFKFHKIDKLLLPEHTASPGNYNESLILQLRDWFVDVKKKPNRVIYISRKKAEKRFVLNEHEIEALLDLYNIEIHCFEDYDFKDQVRLMSETKLLISLHGAGLTNMIFMPSGGKVLEFRKEDDKKNNCFFSLASALGVGYYYLKGKSDSENLNEFNVSIDRIEFENLLKEILVRI